jgi:hypothetical protein
LCLLRRRRQSRGHSQATIRKGMLRRPHARNADHFLTLKARSCLAQRLLNGDAKQDPQR